MTLEKRKYIYQQTAGARHQLRLTLQFIRRLELSNRKYYNNLTEIELKHYKDLYKISKRLYKETTYYFSGLDYDTNH